MKNNSFLENTGLKKKLLRQIAFLVKWLILRITSNNSEKVWKKWLAFFGTLKNFHFCRYHVFYVILVQVIFLPFFQMTSRKTNGKGKSEDCGNYYSRTHAAGFCGSWVEELFLVRNVIIILTTCQKWISIQGKKHLKSTAKSTKCVSFKNEYPNFCSPQQYCKKDHWLKAGKTSDSVADMKNILENKEDSDQLRDQLRERG